MPRVRKGKGMGNMPPPVVVQPVYQRTLRYISAAAESKGTDTITVGSLLNTAFIAASAVTATPLYGAVKLRQVRMYGTQASGSSGFANGSITWIGPRQPPKTVQASGTLTEPYKIVTNPPKGSYAAMWYSGGPDIVSETGNPTLFEVQCSAGSVLDVTFDFTLNDGDVTANNVTIVAGTAGVLYMNSHLDNTNYVYAAGTKNWLLSTIFANLLDGFLSSAP